MPLGVEHTGSYIFKFYKVFGCSLRFHSFSFTHSYRNAKPLLKEKQKHSNISKWRLVLKVIKKAQKATKK